MQAGVVSDLGSTGEGGRLKHLLDQNPRFIAFRREREH